MPRKSLEILGFDPTTELVYEDGLRPIISGSMELLVPAETQGVKVGFLFWDEDPSASGSTANLIRVEAKTSLEGRVVYYDGYASGLPEVTGPGTNLYADSGVIPPGRGDIVTLYPQDGWARVKIEGVEIPRFWDSGAGEYKPALFMEVVFLYSNIISAGGVIRNRRDMLNRGNKSAPFMGAQSKSGGSSSYGTGGASTRVDLTNDSHGIPVDASGNALSLQGAETTANIYEGTVNVSADWNMNIQSGGEVNVTGDLVDKTYTVTSLTDNAGSVTFEFTRSGYATLYATFTLFRNYSGITYTIDVVPNVVEYDTELDVYTPSSIDLSAFTIGASGRDTYSGYFRIFESADGINWGTATYSSASAESTYSYTITGTSQKFVKVELFKDNTFASASLVDVEVIPLLWEALQGEPGTPGHSVFTIEAYKLSETIPTDKPGTVSYNIDTSAWTPLNGWLTNLTSADLVGNPTIWLTTYNVNINDYSSSTITLQNNEWAEPVQVLIEGPTGPTGQASRTVNIYKLNDSTITDDTAGTFNDPLSGMESGWGYSVPSISNDGDIIYTSVRTFTSDGAAPQDALWSTPTIYARRVDGNNAQDVRTVNLYKLNDSTITDDTQGTFNDPTSGMEAGWNYNVPSLNSDGDIVYVTTRTFTSDGAAPQDASWSTPTIYARRVDGSIGDTGPRTATGLLYKLLPSSSAGAITASSFNFTTSTFDTITAGWSTEAPTFEADATDPYWYVRYSVEEDSFGSVGQTVTLSAAQEVISFTGLVTFTALQSDLGETTIHGGNINTDQLFLRTIDVSGQLTIGTVSNGVILNGGAESNRITASHNGDPLFRVSTVEAENILNPKYIRDGTITKSKLSQAVQDILNTTVTESGGLSFEGSGTLVNGTAVTSTALNLEGTITTNLEVICSGGYLMYTGNWTSGSIVVAIRKGTTTVTGGSKTLTVGLFGSGADIERSYELDTNTTTINVKPFSISATTNDSGSTTYNVLVSGIDTAFSTPPSFNFSVSQEGGGSVSYSAGDALNLDGTTFNVDIPGTTATTTVVGLDELLISDGGALRRVDLSVLANFIEGQASGYTHPTHPGDDASVDTGALSGATVISDLDFNITTDTEGHVTDANATVETRNLTAGNIGAEPSFAKNSAFNKDFGSNAGQVAEGNHTHSYLPLTGGTLTNDLTISKSNTTLDVMMTVVNTNDGGGAELQVRGNGQGDGYIFVGQSNTYGGGLAYRGDLTSPKVLNGAVNDRITFYRRTNGVDHEVFSYAHNSDSVTFKGNVTGLSPALAAWGFRRAYVSSTQPSMSTGDIWMEI